MKRRYALQILAAPLLAASRDIQCEIAIIGGGIGGCAAALAALRMGRKVVLTEETDWIGGQLTSQAVPPDEHPWIESFGCTRTYRAYRNAVRRYYRDHYPLVAEVSRRETFNPGGGLVSRLTHEPRVSLAVLEAMLAPYESGGQLVVLLEHKSIAADIEGAKVRSVTLRGTRSGSPRVVHATYFLDATEQGDLLPLTKTEHVVGFESRRQTGEPHAPEQPQPANIQAFTMCFAVDHVKGEDHTIQKPEDYTFWRDYVPKLSPSWPGKLLSMAVTHPITLVKRDFAFDPDQSDPAPGLTNLWLYRRIAAARHFTPGAYASDVSLVNWPQNDYWLGNLHEVSEGEYARHLRGGKQLSLSLLYWLQTEAGWKGLRLRNDVVGTDDGLAKYPYIRESRRIQAEFTVVEQHVGTEARMKQTGQSRENVRAEDFKDTVGVGSYRIDLHPSSGGDNYIDISSLPFQIPLGALIPKRIENLLPACKNLGVTHITNGCYRLHPVEWNIGESAGALAAHAYATKATPREIRNEPKRLADFQKLLESQGVELRWPQITPR